MTKSDGFPQPFLSLEDLEGGTGRLLVDGLPLKAAEDSIEHRPGDVLFSKLRPYLAKSHLPGKPGTGTGELLVLRPSAQIDPRFLFYVTLSHPWLEWANATAYGTKMPRTAWELLSEYRMWLPSVEEQRRIADFLDAETARIDTLASRRSKQTEAMAERELALIADMLSGSVESGKGQLTGWPWLPEIPINWSIGPVYAYFLTELGKMLNVGRANGRNQLPYLRNANVHWYEITIDDLATMDFAADEVRRYSVTRGDLLICEGGAGVAEAAVWDGRLQECYFQKSLHRVRRAGPVPVEWLMYWLRLAKACGVFEAEGNVATIPHLTGEQLRRYRIPIPIDGDSLVERTSEEISRLTSVRTKLSQAQALLAERRQALITAAVTGQIDVSTASGRGIEK
ncbi:restriction endonuclease subunit S [Streptomyces sp. JJ38]|uniref:restriction endonuclease subunit S n=1 Tax=Streptomyces sp. JJ38 TaxID=2738128 RepID=UPI001C5A3FC3|nr:restriction endonuclease subunit S [Streptomyces sp. JJ38]